jgi:hypothetical protein
MNLDASSTNPSSSQFLISPKNKKKQKKEPQRPPDQGSSLRLHAPDAVELYVAVMDDHSPDVTQYAPSRNVFDRISIVGDCCGRWVYIP